MPFNGAGSFSRLYSWVTDKANGVKINATRMDAEFDGIATGLSTCLTKDGQTNPTADLPMNGRKITGYGTTSAPSARSDVASLGNVQDATASWVDGGGTADAITAAYSPAITALVDGQLCRVRATAANTVTNPTFAPNGLTARTIYREGQKALRIGDIKGDNHELLLVYHATSTWWELLNPASSLLFDGGTAGGTADALTCTCAPTLGALVNGVIVAVRAASANATTTPTFAPDSLTAKTITKNGNQALVAGDIYGAGHELWLRYNSSNDKWELLNPAAPDSAADINALGEGEHQICVTARYLRPTTTNGCANIAVHESSTNKVCFEYLAFDASSAEYAFFVCKAPKSADETAGIYVKNLAWAHPSTTTNFGVSWKVQFLARSNDDAADTAYGTAIEVADTGGTTHDVYIAPDSAVITPGGSWAEGDWLFGRIQRDPADGDDTMAVDAWLIGFDLVFTIAAANDA